MASVARTPVIPPAKNNAIASIAINTVIVQTSSPVFGMTFTAYDWYGHGAPGIPSKKSARDRKPAMSRSRSVALA
jgi:hypothetical protein